ncbi:YhgE/Pip domain-containing protein [Planosporangium thailandense]|uniref:YhgE/Pip domain-containing protein n=1 Tax=Planosporangium thailandense TaxID=765197 RepID=A0ABX0Y4M1_9ACTN|nr:YhgE/Pip domain-containing protein [Planosporangium thailandense]NJC72259.1 YhgE/Pip domain-containing protein [Planosporangium thailandense]
MKLALFELRRFRRALLSRVALVVLTLIPLLYGALYLWAFWDPYGNLKRIPVALVNEDRPAKAPDGSTIHAGQDLTDELINRNVFAWHAASLKDADKGLANGSYHLIFHIPADFSSSLASPLDKARDPERGKLVVVNDDATNYLSGLLARSAFTEVRAAAAKSTAQRYFNKMLIGFTDLKAETEKAANGAGQLADGTQRAHGGANQVADGADRAAGGAGQLASGLAAANKGASDLATGLAALDAGSAQLADGSAQVAGGTQLLASKVDALDDQAGPILRRDAPLIQRAAQLIAAGANTAADNADQLPGLSEKALQSAKAAQAIVNQFVSSPAGQQLPPEQRDKLTNGAAQAVTDTQTLYDAVHRVDVPTLRNNLKELAGIAQQIADAAPHLADDLGGARRQVDQLNAGAQAVAVGADRLHQGAAQASGGAKTLNGGLYRLSTGARQLDSGLAALSDGTHQLANGLSTLESGAGQLADGLAGGAQKIPGYDPDERVKRSGVLGDPVELNRQARHAAATYGVGFAPYFLALALWVGAMITYMLLRPVTRRYLVSAAPAVRVALAGWLPAVVIGLVQASVLLLVLWSALGLTPVHPIGTLGFLFLVAVAFTAILQWLGAQLGPAGRLVALALLMLQLTSSGGTYPVQTTPAFFQHIHPFLPMTYVVDSLRHLIDGGPAGTVIKGSLVLAGFAAAAFGLTTLAAWRGRRLSPSKLHPDLVM